MWSTMRARALKSVKASFLFFFSGVVAGAGVNLITGTIGSSSPPLVVFAQLWWGVYGIVVSFIFSMLAGAKENTDLEFSNLSTRLLTREEKSELLENLTLDLSNRVRPIIITILITSVMFLAGFYLVGHLIK